MDSIWMVFKHIGPTPQGRDRRTHRGAMHPKTGTHTPCVACSTRRMERLRNEAVGQGVQEGHQGLHVLRAQPRWLAGLQTER